MAWARGYFVFDQDDIKQVMNTLARWYDIEVVYEGNLKGKTFGGTLSRYTDFRQLLHAIEQTGSVKFTITGRRVTVSP
jgi:ferric-dicitrate binding protein FerR (iron transport regulator)